MPIPTRSLSYYEIWRCWCSVSIDCLSEESGGAQWINTLSVTHCHDQPNSTGVTKFQDRGENECSIEVLPSVRKEQLFRPLDERLGCSCPLPAGLLARLLRPPPAWHLCTKIR